MTLEGDLGEFAFGDVLRSLGSRAKTGVLHVTHPSGEGVVCFRDGEVVYASPTGDHVSLALALARAGIVSEKQLQHAQGLMMIQKKHKAERGLGQILLAEGCLDSDVLRAFVRTQVSDACFEMLRLREGQVRFEPHERYPDVELGFSVPVDLVLVDAAARLEASERVGNRITSLDARFEISAAPGRASAEIRLKPAEWVMLCHLHGGRSVRELARLSGYSDLETASVLSAMFSGGLVEHVGDV